MKNKSLLALPLLALLAWPAGAQDKTPPPAQPKAGGAPAQADGAKPAPAPTGVLKVAIETTKGKIVLQLFPEKAPKTVANFLAYADAGYYTGTIFHRVIDSFMIQGGGFTINMEQKTPNPPVKNEADNGLTNDRGTIAMARTANPDSATAQFFINTSNNAPLNHKDKSPKGWGYTVFGKVVEGMDVVDAIGKVRTGNKNNMSDVPLEQVIIKKVSRVR